MNKMKKKYLISAGVIIIILILGFIYRQAHIEVTGFNIPKREFTNVIISTKENNYMVTDSNLVLGLVKEVSKMQKFSKIDPFNYPLNKEYPSKFTGILVQTKNSGTIGGSFWHDGNNVVLDSNGYYWIATKGLFELMEESLKDAQKLN